MIYVYHIFKTKKLTSSVGLQQLTYLVDKHSHCQPICYLVKQQSNYCTVEVAYCDQIAFNKHNSRLLYKKLVIGIMQLILSASLSPQ